MTPEEVYQFYGEIADAAEAVNVSRQTFHTWIRKGAIPIQQQLRYEKLSKKKLKASKSAKEDEAKIPYFPRFRYYSEALGMCDVHSLTYFSVRGPRIRYYSPLNRQLRIATFNIHNLMQSICFRDSEGKLLFEKDIIFMRDIRRNLTVENDYVARCMGLLTAEFLIVGNTFEGKKDDNN